MSTRSSAEPLAASLSEKVRALQVITPAVIGLWVVAHLRDSLRHADCAQGRVCDGHDRGIRE
jgi:hypothetical protein